MNGYERNNSLLFAGFVALATAFILAVPAMAGSGVFESFEYEEPLVVGETSGGEGWSGPWRSDVSLTQPLDLPVVVDKSLDAPANLKPVPSGGHFEGSSMILCRGLAVGREIDLSSDQACYISFLERRSLKGDDKSSTSVALMLYDKLTSVIGLGHGSGGKLVVFGSAAANGTRPAVGFDHTYLWIIKLSEPDAKQMRRAHILVYSSTKRFPDREPPVWSLTSEPFPADNFVIDRIRIVMGKNIVLSLDELRIGTSWQEVVAAAD